MSEDKTPMVDDEIINPDDMFLTVELDDGGTATFQVVKIFEVDGQDYIAVASLEDDDTIYFYRHFEDEDGTPYVDNIEEDEEFERIVARFDELLEEVDEEIEEEFGEELGEEIEEDFEEEIIEGIEEEIEKELEEGEL